MIRRAGTEQNRDECRTRERQPSEEIRIITLESTDHIIIRAYGPRSLFTPSPGEGAQPCRSEGDPDLIMPSLLHAVSITRQYNGSSEEVRPARPYLLVPDAGCFTWD